jgi:hypothetical protein
MESQKVFESNKIKEANLLVIAYSAMREHKLPVEMTVIRLQQITSSKDNV